MISAQLFAAMLFVAPSDDPAAGRMTVQRADGQPPPASLTAALQEELDAYFVAQCTNPPCDPATRPKVEVTVSERERDYTAAVVITRDDGAPTETTVTCSICTPAEVGHKIAAGVVAVLDTPKGVLARLEVNSNPSGAIVEIDGTPVGHTPLSIEVAPGAHEVLVRKAGHHDVRRPIELAESGAEILRIELPADRSSRARTMEVTGWSLVGVGVAGVVTGIALLVVDENPVKNNCDGVHVDRFGNCEFRWNTLGAGVGVMVTGVVAAASGAVLVTMGRRGRARTPGPHARLVLGPTRIGVRVRF